MIWAWSLVHACVTHSCFPGWRNDWYMWYLAISGAMKNTKSAVCCLLKLTQRWSTIITPSVAYSEHITNLDYLIRLFDFYSRHPRYSCSRPSPLVFFFILQAIKNWRLKLDDYLVQLYERDVSDHSLRAVYWRWLLFVNKCNLSDSQ